MEERVLETNVIAVSKVDCCDGGTGCGGDLKELGQFPREENT